MLGKGEYHKCNKCKTPHFEDKQKLLVNDPECTGETYYSVHVCFACGHEEFLVMKDNKKSEELKPLISELLEKSKEVFDTREDFQEWLSRPNFSFGNKLPRTFLRNQADASFTIDRLVGMAQGDNA